MKGLLYPAVLGAYFYNHLGILNLVFFKLWELPISKYPSFISHIVIEKWICFLLSASLLFHFCVDYIYTENLRKQYNHQSFILDLIVLLILYIAISESNFVGRTVNIQIISFCMMLAYGIFFTIDLIVRRSEKKIINELLKFEFIGFIFYIAVTFWFTNALLLAIGTLILSAFLLYYCPDSILHRKKTRDRFIALRRVRRHRL
jgi:hypothetical protein